MSEKELITNISNLYSKFFDVQQKNEPNCDCGKQTKTKKLSFGSKIIHFASCESCNKLIYFKELHEYKNGKYQQIWLKLPSNEIKNDLEKFLENKIPRVLLESYTPAFEELVMKIEAVEKKNKQSGSQFKNN